MNEIVACDVLVRKRKIVIARRERGERAMAEEQQNERNETTGAVFQLSCIRSPHGTCALPFTSHSTG